MGQSAVEDHAFLDDAEAILGRTAQPDADLAADLVQPLLLFRIGAGPGFAVTIEDLDHEVIRIEGNRLVTAGLTCRLTLADALSEDDTVAGRLGSLPRDDRLAQHLARDLLVRIQVQRRSLQDLTVVRKPHLGLAVVRQHTSEVERQAEKVLQGFCVLLSRLSLRTTVRRAPAWALAAAFNPSLNHLTTVRRSASDGCGCRRGGMSPALIMSRT